MNIQQYRGEIMELGNEPTNITKKYRRNGKLQSCEPCRYSKVRCDHTLPACLRCVKQSRVEKCIYHPAPQTQNPIKKRKNSAAIVRSPSTRASPVSSTVAQSIESTFTTYIPATPISQIGVTPFPPFGATPLSQFGATPIPQLGETTYPNPRARAVSAPVILDDNRDPTIRNHEGFLGSTSYSSIFEDDLHNLGIVGRVPTGLNAKTPVETISTSIENIRKGCKVLSFLKESVLVNQCIHRYCEIQDYAGEAVLVPMVTQWLAELWRHHAPTLQEQAPDRVQRLSELIWKNTQTPIVFDGNTSPRQWASLNTGHNLRWEVIGIIAVQIGLTAVCLDPSDKIFSENKVSRELLKVRMHEVSEICLSFCRDCDTQGDTFMWLLQEGTFLTLSLQGNGYRSYQESGELNNAFIARGLHQTIKADAQTPFFLAETRKRNRLQIYGQEVALSSILGRPCRLSFRYTQLDPPLDLTDHELFLEGKELNDVLTRVDGDGWNKARKWCKTTFLRANMYHAPIREEVLDISLGDYTREEVLKRVTKIQTKYEKAWTSAPEFLCQARDTPAATNPPTKFLDCLYHNVVRQGHLGNQVLLQRVLIRKTGASSDKLIGYARPLFKDCLYLTGRYEILKDYQLDFAYLLASHGLRSAAVIAVELLKQEQLLEYPLDPQLPRSETIQDLSIFVSRLQSVDRSNGLFAFCDQGRRIISCVLDKVLAPPKRVAMVAEQRSIEPLPEQGYDDIITGMRNPDFGGFDAPLNDADFQLWLENMDFENSGVIGVGGGWTGF